MVQALIREKEVSRKDFDVVFTIQFLIGLCIYILFYFLSPWFAKWYHNPIYLNLLRVSALSFIYRPLVNLPNSILQRNMQFKLKILVNFSALLISVLSSIGFAYQGYGVWSLIWGGIAGALTSIMLLAIATRWYPRLCFDIKHGKGLAHYGMLKATNDIVLYLRSQASLFIISRTMGPTNVGLYNKGESLASMPHTFFSGSVQPVLFRALSMEQGNQDKCEYMFFRSITLLAVYTTPFYVGLTWLARPLVELLYGDKWIESSIPLTILAYSWPFLMLSTLSSTVLAARNWLNRDLFVLIASVIVACLSIVIAIPYGIKGVAWAVFGTTAYASIHQYFLATSCLRSSCIKIFPSLMPAIFLNSILFLILIATDRWLPEEIKTNPFLYISCMGMAGAISYLVCFLFIPIKSLRTEQIRWKSKLRLAESVA